MSNMLTIKDIAGTVNLQSRDNRIIIPHAYATSDNIIVGGKGLIEQELRDGVIYARYKKVDALLSVTAGKKKISLIKAREKFDQYQLERPGR